MDNLLQQLYTGIQAVLKEHYQNPQRDKVEPRKRLRFYFHPVTLYQLRQLPHEELELTGLLNYSNPTIFGFQFVETTLVNDWSLGDIPEDERSKA